MKPEPKRVSVVSYYSQSQTDTSTWTFFAEQWKNQEPRSFHTAWSDGIDLVHENDRRCMFSGHNEQFTDL